MKQNIAILGSTGSIGKSLIKIISRDIKKFNISLLSANKNYKLILKQAKKFNVKYLKKKMTIQCALFPVLKV